MDLAKLQFNVDTSQLEKAIRLVGDLEKASEKLGKGESVPSPKPATEQAYKRLDGQVRAFYDNSAKGAAKAIAADELLAKTLERLTLKSEALAAGFKSSESSLISV